MSSYSGQWQGLRSLVCLTSPYIECHRRQSHEPIYLDVKLHCEIQWIRGFYKRLTNFTRKCVNIVIIWFEVQEFYRLRSSLRAKQEHASLLEDFRDFDRTRFDLEENGDSAEQGLLKEQASINRNSGHVCIHSLPLWLYACRKYPRTWCDGLLCWICFSSIHIHPDAEMYTIAESIELYSQNVPDYECDLWSNPYSHIYLSWCRFISPSIK